MKARALVIDDNAAIIRDVFKYIDTYHGIEGLGILPYAIAVIQTTWM